MNDYSPASKAGLVVGDVVCCINKTNVQEMEHKTALEHVKENPNHIHMTIIDRKAFSLYKSMGITVTHAYAEELGKPF